MKTGLPVILQFIKTQITNSKYKMPNPKTSNSKLKRAIIKSMPIIVNQRQKK